VSLLSGHTLVSIGSFEAGGFVELDCSLSENHVFSAEVTEHPVEIGGDISDNVKQNPDEVTITGIVTNYPAQWLASLSTIPGRAETALEQLRSMKALGKLVDVVTGLREYSSMIISRVEAPRSAGVGDAVQVTVTLRNVQVVQSKTVAAPVPAQARGTATSAAGKKPPAAADAAQSGSSTSTLAAWSGL